MLLSLLRLRTRFGMRLPARWWLAFGYGVAALVGSGLLSNALGLWDPIAIVVRICLYGLLVLSLLALLDRTERLQLAVLAKRVLLRVGIDLNSADRRSTFPQPVHDGP
jgi:hypothetical protein